MAVESPSPEVAMFCTDPGGLNTFPKGLDAGRSIVCIGLGLKALDLGIEAFYTA